MDKVKTLPPLVYGKLSGVLEFFIDEVKITENFNFESNVCDIIIQIQWWGETIPSCIRPLRISYFSKRNEPILDSKVSLHSLTYEIKTNVELFKSYLKSTEVMELAVYDKIENAIIGSAFVKDLVSIIFNDKIVVIPVINYFGNRIGDLKIRLAFHQFNVGDSKDSSPKKSMYFPAEHNLPRPGRNVQNKENLNEFHQTISDNIKRQLQSLDISDSEGCTRTRHYNTPVSCHHEKHTGSSKTSLSEKSQSPPKNSGPGNKKPSANRLPEKEIYEDSSKVLYFHINPAKKLAQKKIVSKISLKEEALRRNNKPISKAISKEKIQITKPVVIEFKTSEKTSPERLKKKNYKKSPDDVKTFQNVSEKISEINKIYLTPTKSTSQSDLEKIPVKEFKKKKKQPNTRVLDYLLGKEMSKQEENLALNEFKNMSPCQNIVTSITELCNENVSIKNKIENCNPVASSDLSNKSKKIIQVKGNLQFNLTDPVEKLYYQTFFSGKIPEYEVVELLNQPENKFILDRRKEKYPFKESKKKSVLTVNNVEEPNFNFESKTSCCDVGKQESVKNCENNCEFVKNCHDGVKPMDDLQIGPNNCLRCKYYKKLGELDKIIESLKVFEDRMKTIEKESKPKIEDVILDECNIDFAERDGLLFDSPSSLTNLDLNEIEDDMQSISNEVHIERKNLLDDFNDDLESSFDDSDFMEFSDYLIRSKRVI